MGLVEDELHEVQKLCEHVVQGTKLVSCVRTMFRANYPESLLLFELKSKTLSEKLLLAFTNACEQELKKLLGKPQILHLIKFIRRFIDENALICCYDEIANLKKALSEQDELKLKQKTSLIVLKVYNGEYYLTGRLSIPDNYPQSCVEIQDFDTNFTATFYKHMIAQAKEIARRCVEAPLKTKPNSPPFRVAPSLEKTALFLIDCVKRLPSECCQFCKKSCFPMDHTLLEKDETSPLHIERVYCGHLFHQGCLLDYMKQPPFGNKKCVTCGKKIAHFKWTLTDHLAEARWAHEQARERELQEVTDFFS